MDLHELSLKELLSLDLVEINAGEDNTFYKGAWSVGYRYLYMNMEGYLDGQKSVSTAEILKTFAIAQPRMSQEMHLIEASYAPTDRLSVLLGIPYIMQTTEHQRRPGANPFVGEEFDVTTDGLSDISAKLAYTVYKAASFQILTFAGVGFPTGSIDETGTVPRGQNQPLPYTMQLGSGTYDLNPGIAYSAQAGKWSWGTEFMYKSRLGKNDAGYSFGDRYSATVYLTRRLFDWVAPSIVVTGRSWESISGRDPRLDPVAKAVPVANPNFYGGDRIDLIFRLNFAIPRGMLKGNRLSVEGGIPIYQDLNGPQVQSDYRFGVSWQWTF